MIATATNADPQQRYASASKLRDALAATLSQVAGGACVDAGKEAVARQNFVDREQAYCCYAFSLFYFRA